MHTETPGWRFILSPILRPFFSLLHLLVRVHIHRFLAHDIFTTIDARRLNRRGRIVFPQSSPLSLLPTMMIFKCRWHSRAGASRRARVILLTPLSQLCAAFREPSQQFCRRGQRASAVQRLHATRARGVLISILIGAGAAPCGIFNLDEI